MRRTDHKKFPDIKTLAVEVARQAQTTLILYTHHNHNHGTQSNPKRPNRQTHRRRWPSLTFAASWSGSGFQRCKVDGFLQGEQSHHTCWHRIQERSKVLMGVTGVQRPHCVLRPRHPRPSARNRPPRPQFHLRTPYASHRLPPPQCRRRGTQEKQTPRRRQCGRT